MARLDIFTRTFDGETKKYVEVVLSRRNLVALLSKLDWPESERTILNNDCRVEGEHVDDLLLILRCEDDETHYGSRPSPPGAMHPQTEEAIRVTLGKPPRFWK